MSYKMNYLDDKKIVQVDITGRLNFETVQKYSTEALKLAHEYNCSKFLINHTLTLPEAGGYKLHADGDTLEHFGFKSIDKIAIVVTKAKDHEHFIESEKSNIKWCNFRYFDDISKAYNWLMEN
ncbi:MAG TPA: hypothetical protein VLB50_14165 [Ignavibacteriaceae bacterium]|nr:hypothetical protein [Ignavibacteriaceae bacterium]